MAVALQEKDQVRCPGPVNPLGKRAANDGRITSPQAIPFKVFGPPARVANPLSDLSPS
jgi:hypothetical protein